MQDDDVPAQSVPYAQVLAANVRAARARANITQTSLAQRMRLLGSRWHFQTVGAVERGERPLSAYELPALAIALQTTTDVLALPPPDVALVAFGDQVIPAQRLTFVDDSVTWEGDAVKVTQPPVQYRPLDQRLAALQAQDPEHAAKVAQYAAHLRRQTQASEQPIAAAIVTSSRGVLVGRRVDGKPPWTFIAGEVEPFDGSLADTAIREVKEEAGLEVRVGHVIGERDHPQTGRHMVYLAARPASRSTKIAVSDEAELAEVRWVSLVEADDLMPGMYGPVREHLARTIGHGETRGA